jgi:hypothetical protein
MLPKAERNKQNQIYSLFFYYEGIGQETFAGIFPGGFQNPEAYKALEVEPGGYIGNEYGFVTLEQQPNGTFHRVPNEE